MAEREKGKGWKVSKKIFFFKLDIGLIFNQEKECKIYYFHMWGPRIQLMMMT